MPLKRSRIAILEVGREQVGLSKTQFDRICRKYGARAGVASLDDTGFVETLRHLKLLGFKPKRKVPKPGIVRRQERRRRERDAMATASEPETPPRPSSDG